MLLGGEHALGDLRLRELRGRGGEELLFIEGVFQEMWPGFIVLVFFVFAVVALIVG